MLGTFREKVVKWGTMALFGLLLLSFVGWGIGDYIGFSGGRRNLTVASVGDQSITTRAFQNAMQDQMNRMRQILGDAFGVEQARAMGLDESVLQGMIQDALYTEGARRLGLIVDDSVVVQEIRAEPRFQNGPGFDRARFDSTLRELGMSEGQYVAELKKELLRVQYLSPVAFGRRAPDLLVDTIYRHRNERRVAQVLTLPHDSIKDVPAPSQADLEKFHSEQAAQFTAPEYRAFTVARLRPSDVIEEMDIPEAQLRTYYEDHIYEFSEPERRTIQQVLFDDEKSAGAARERIAKGEDFAKVAKDVAGVAENALVLGTLSKDEVPIPELADVAFTLNPGEVSKPVQSPIGWHLVRMTESKPATRKSFAEAKDEIHNRLAAEMANEALYKLSARFEDELGGGAGLEDAAKRLKIGTLKVAAADRNGRDPDGNGIEGLSPEIVRTVFDTSQGSDSTLQELGGQGGYYMVHVDKVMPQALRPLGEIKDRVAAAWSAGERAKRAEAIVKRMIEDIKSGKLLAEVAKTNGATLATTEPFNRTREGLNIQLPGPLVPALFKSAPGTPEMASAGNAHVVAVVSQVNAADPKADGQGLERLRGELAGAIANDLSIAMAGALRERISVSVDRAAVESAY